MKLYINQNKNICLVGIAILLVISLLLLIGPRVPYNLQKQYCVVDLHLVGPFGLSLNCDSPEFMNDAVHPSRLLSKNSVRQSRPGMVLAAYLLSKPLSFLNKLSAWYHPSVTRKDIAKDRVNALLQSGFSVFAAYALLNFVILISAGYLYFQLVQVSQGVSLASLSLIIILFLNSITEVYFWSPHTQMFNIMGPLFLAWILNRGLHQSVLKLSWYAVTLLMGFLVTAYGTFILYAPCLFFLFVYHFVSEKESLVWHYSRALITHAVLFSLPTLVWYLIVKHVAGSYYVHEAVVYRQFTWMSDAWHQGGVVTFLSHLGMNLYKVCDLLIKQNILFALAIGVLSYFGYRLGYRDWDNLRLVALCITAVLCALFVVFNGFVIPRMTSTVIPLSVVACGYLLECLFTRLSTAAKHRLNGTVLVLIFAYAGWILL